MSIETHKTSLADRALLGAASLVAKTWPIAAKIFPEGPDIDTNQSLWAAQTPDYQAGQPLNCLLYTSPSPRDQRGSRMPSSA